MSSFLNRNHWKNRIFTLRSETDFTQAALELFEIQRRSNPVYRRLCQARQTGSIHHWKEIPAVPQRLFKEAIIYGNPQSFQHEFHTSGTTTGKPGVHRMRDLSIYRAAALSGFPWDRSRMWRMIFLHPTPKEAPHSSLSQMLAWWKSEWADPRSITALRQGQIDSTSLEQGIRSARGPVLIAGTAFSFVHLLDLVPKLPPLPSGSIVMETGGYKGRSRVLDKKSLYAGIQKIFGIRDSQIWNEYGMTELSSQAYAHGWKGEHQVPPWARVLVIDPIQNREVPVEETGVVRWIDLANVDSVLAVQTLDLAIRTKTGFRLIGRAPQAERRGCSLRMEMIT